MRKWTALQKIQRRSAKVKRFNEMKLSREMKAIYPYDNVLEMLVRSGKI